MKIKKGETVELASPSGFSPETLRPRTGGFLTPARNGNLSFQPVS
jgi:hypothetical protein